MYLHDVQPNQRLFNYRNNVGQQRNFLFITSQVEQQKGSKNLLSKLLSYSHESGKLQWPVCGEKNHRKHERHFLLCQLVVNVIFPKEHL